jgi:hypothetical protein
VTDWPADGWHVLSPERHAWPPPLAVDGKVGVRGAFQWAMDASAVWLAVRVEGGPAVAESGAQPAADEVDVLLTGYRAYDSGERHRRDHGGSAVLSLSLADAISSGRIRGPGGLALARPAGTDERFEQWWARRYGQKPVVDEQVTLATVRTDGRTQYELRIDRSCFAAGEPRGFDVRVTSGGACLEWGGAVYSSAVFPPAAFLPGK